MDEILKIVELNHMPPPTSHLWVLGIDMIAILSLGVWIREIRVARRAADLAKRTENAALPLYDGARFISGDVEFASRVQFSDRSANDLRSVSAEIAEF